MTRLVLHRLRYELVKFWRDPQAVFFTVALPVVFLVIVASIFGNETLDDRSGLKVSTYYVPGIIALGVMSAAFVALAIARSWSSASAGSSSACARPRCRRARSSPLVPR